MLSMGCKQVPQLLPVVIIFLALTRTLSVSVEVDRFSDFDTPYCMRATTSYTLAALGVSDTESISRASHYTCAYLDMPEIDHKVWAP